MDYFTIKQQFYTGNFKEALSEIAKFNKTQDDTLVYYKNRSLLGLGNYEVGQNPENLLSQVFDAYYAFLGRQKGELKELESAVDAAGKSPYALNLLACAQAIAGDFDSALSVCVEGIDSGESIGASELLLTAVQVTLLNAQPGVASTMFENFKSLQEQTNDDEIILNFAESYINFNLGKQIRGSNFYFYEELSQTFPSWKTQLGLLNLHLQQVNLPEARAIIELLEGEFYASQGDATLYEPDLLANKITYTILAGGNSQELRQQLKELNPSHPFCVNDEKNNGLFDEIVSKYSS